MVTSSKLTIGSSLIVAVQLLISGCSPVEQIAAGGSPIATNPQDSQSYAQSAQDAATCALTNAPDSAPARMAAAKSREAADASAAATRAASELAAKRAAADKAESDVKAAEADSERAQRNHTASSNRFNRAVYARNDTFENYFVCCATKDEKMAHDNIYNKNYDGPKWTDEDYRRLENRPEQIATQNAVNEADLERRTDLAEREAAERRLVAAQDRAMAARAEVARATAAAEAANDRAYAAMVESRQHALNASPNCSHLAGIDAPKAAGPTPGEMILRGLIPSVGIGIGGGRSGGSGGSAPRPSGEGHK